MFNVGDRVTCEYFDDDEIFEITKKRRVFEFTDDGDIESDEFRYDIESDSEFDDDVPEDVLHIHKTTKKFVFVDGKEYELRLGLIVKYVEELDQLVNEDGLTLEGYCYDENGKCDFCSEFDIISPETTDSKIHIKPASINIDGIGTIEGIFGYGDECEKCNKFKPYFDNLTFYIK